MKGNISYNVKKVNNNEWDTILTQFEDSNIYQTVAFNKLSNGGEDLEQFILKQNDEIIAACLLRIKTIPFLKRGVAYLRWGPIWKKKECKIDPEVFNLTLQKLKEEYCDGRKFILQISSKNFYEDKIISSENFLNNNFKQVKNSTKTILIDLSKDETTLKMNLRKKWRYTLKQSEKNGLIVEHNTSNEYFQIFSNIYNQMLDRKKFTEYVDANKFKEINSLLPESQKMEIFVCKQNEKPLSTVIVSTIGDTGLYLLGSSTTSSLKLSASYFLQWEVIKWLKTKGIIWYDLGGVDAIENPGGYTFKTGMGGTELTFLGSFAAGNNSLSQAILSIGKLLRKRK